VFINISSCFYFSDVLLLSRAFLIMSVKFFCEEVCVHVRDVNRAPLYIVIFVKRFNVSNECEYILLL
jgi:hypothetical protein